MRDSEWWQRLGRTVSPAQALGMNVARRRKSMHDMQQATLARRLTELGLPARQNTVSRIENATRPVTVDELVALDYLLWPKPDPKGARIAELLSDPSTWQRSVSEELERQLARELAQLQTLERSRDELSAHIDEALVRVRRVMELMETEDAKAKRSAPRKRTTNRKGPR